MKYLFVICAAFALFFSVLLFSKRKKHIEDYLLGGIFSLLTINCFYVFLLARSTDQFYIPYLSEFVYAIPLLYGPLAWLYTKAVTLTSFRLKAVQWLHFVPFIGFFIYFTAPLWSGMHLLDSSQLGYPLIKLLITPFYIIAIIVLIRKYNRKFLEEYSFEMEANLAWLNCIIVGAILAWIIATLSYIYNVINPQAEALYDYNTVSFLTLYLFVLGIVAIRYTKLFSSKGPIPQIQKVELFDEEPEELPTVEVDVTATDMIRLEEVMEQKKVYLDPQLTLSKLAKLTGIPAYRLSRVMKAKESHFFDYVNGYRIEKVKALLGDGTLEQLSMLGIATEAGFNSKASFNRVFKKSTGMTPTEYVKQLNS